MNPRDGQFKILEINARPWWYVEFASRCGVDVCTMSYRDALESPVTSVTDYQAGRRCMMFAIDMFAFHALRGKEPALTFGERMDSLRNADDALFTARDPLPALSHWGSCYVNAWFPARHLALLVDNFVCLINP